MRTSRIRQCGTREFHSQFMEFEEVPRSVNIWTIPWPQESPIQRRPGGLMVLFLFTMGFSDDIALTTLI